MTKMTPNMELTEGIAETLGMSEKTRDWLWQFLKQHNKIADKEEPTPAERKSLLKEMTIAVSLCGSDKPERKAEVCLEAVEKFFNLLKKG